MKVSALCEEVRGLEEATRTGKMWSHLPEAKKREIEGPHPEVEGPSSPPNVQSPTGCGRANPQVANTRSRTWGRQRSTSFLNHDAPSETPHVPPNPPSAVSSPEHPTRCGSHTIVWTQDAASPSGPRERSENQETSTRSLESASPLPLGHPGPAETPPSFSTHPSPFSSIRTVPREPCPSCPTTVSEFAKDFAGTVQKKTASPTTSRTRENPR